MADTVVGDRPDPHVSGEDPSRRDFIHIAAGAAAVGAAAALAWPLIDQMNPAGDTLALASIEFDLTKVAKGQQVTVKAATTIAGRFARAFGEPIETPHEGLDTLFPAAARVASASESEVARNPRARSAVLRAAQRIA